MRRRRATTPASQSGVAGILAELLAPITSYKILQRRLTVIDLGLGGLTTDDPPRSPSTSRHDDMPIFPDTRDGRAARLAYYEARKLNNSPNSLLDYNDAKRGLEPPAERRARERRDNRLPDRHTAIKRVALPPEGDRPLEPSRLRDEAARSVGGQLTRYTAVR